MHLDAITDRPTPPEGTIETPTGRFVADDGHGRLLRALDEAFELHNAHADVTVAGATTRFAPGGHEDGAFEIAPGLVARPGGVEWLGEHSADLVTTARFRVDGRETTIAWSDPYATAASVRA